MGCDPSANNSSSPFYRALPSKVIVLTNIHHCHWSLWFLVLLRFRSAGEQKDAHEFLPHATSPNENIFRVTGHLCGKFTGPGEFPTRRPVTRSFNVFFDLRLNIGLSKQSWGWWSETLSRPLYRHCNGLSITVLQRNFPYGNTECNTFVVPNAPTPMYYTVPSCI